MVQRFIRPELCIILLPLRPVLIGKLLRKKRSLGVSVNVIRRRALLRKVLGAVILVAQRHPEEAATAALILVGSTRAHLLKSINLKPSPKLKLKLIGQKSFRRCVRNGLST
tara:strand:+ start:179 stop:511 length:333 start_codon:yes stop_codon:yes gene_type:complete